MRASKDLRLVWALAQKLAGRHHRYATTLARPFDAVGVGAVAAKRAQRLTSQLRDLRSQLFVERRLVRRALRESATGPPETFARDHGQRALELLAVRVGGVLEPPFQTNLNIGTKLIERQRQIRHLIEPAEPRHMEQQAERFGAGDGTCDRPTPRGDDAPQREITGKVMPVLSIDVSAQSRTSGSVERLSVQLLRVRSFAGK